MQKPAAIETREKLIRLRADRRGAPVELRVHYEIRNQNGCHTYSIITVEEAN